METTRSRPHRCVEALLDGLGISYVSECEDFQPYSIDIFLPEWHLAIEVDGPYHTPKGDKQRDAVLKAIGVETLRLKGTMTAATRTATQTKMVDFIQEHALTTKMRKAMWHASKA